MGCQGLRGMRSDGCRQYLLTRESLILTCHCAAGERHHCHQQWAPFHLPCATTVGVLTLSRPAAIPFCSCPMSEQAKPQEPKPQYPKAGYFVYKAFRSPADLTALLPRFGTHFRKNFLQFLFISHEFASQEDSTGI